MAMLRCVGGRSHGVRVNVDPYVRDGKTVEVLVPGETTVEPVPVDLEDVPQTTVVDREVYRVRSLNVDGARVRFLTPESWSDMTSVTFLVGYAGDDLDTDDCWMRREHDEPHFTLLARDPLFGPLVQLWIELRIQQGEDYGDAPSVFRRGVEWLEARGGQFAMLLPTRLQSTGRKRDRSR